MENPKKAQKEAQQKIDDAVELTEEEQGKYIPSHLSLYFYEFSIKKSKKTRVNRVKEFRITSCLAAREEMLTQGFTNWSKRDFNAFIRVREIIQKQNFMMFHYYKT